MIHCGDIGSPEIVGLFGRWPTHFVLGNVDTPAQPLRAAIEAAGQTCHGRFGALEAGGRANRLPARRRLRGYCTRRSPAASTTWCATATPMSPSSTTSGRTLVLNPGALYRAQPHSLAIVRLPELEATHVAL